MKRKIIILIVVSYFVGLIFTLFEFEKRIEKKWHPFFDGITYQNGDKWNGWVTDAVFAYGFMEMVSRGLIFLAAYLAVSHKIFLKLFIVCFWVELADMFDYWLFRNDPYPLLPKYETKYGTLALEFNYIKLAIVSYFAWTDWNRKTS